MCKISQEKIEEIREIANEKVEFILEALGLDIDNAWGSNQEIRMACPIHNGANRSAFCYNQKYKVWKCYTGNCHENDSTIFGLVSKILNIPFNKSVEWVGSKLGIGLDNKEENPEDLEIFKLVKKNHKVLNTEQNKETFKPFSIDKIDGKIDISKYFLDKGISEKVLRKYNVGYCDDKSKPMYLYSYAPILDDEGKIVVGVTGRTIYEECEFCGCFHEPHKGCPHENPRVKRYPKWKHFGFNSGAVLYNYWFAKDLIKKSGVAILTEGPKDVWWMEQYDIHNGLGIFGLNINKVQIQKLLKNGVLTIVTGLDKDKRGMAANKKLSTMLSSYFKIVDISHLMKEDEDIADISEDRMKNEFAPFVRSLER